MKKPTLLFSLNVLSFVCLSFLASSGLLLEFVLLRGTTTWGLDRHTWIDIHFWTAMTFLSIIVAHVFVHWKWIRSVVRGRIQERATRRARIAIAVVTLVVGIVVSPFLLAKEPPPPAGTDAAPGIEARGTGTGSAGGLGAAVSAAEASAEL